MDVELWNQNESNESIECEESPEYEESQSQQFLQSFTPSTLSYFPQVNHDRKPKIGQEFKSLEDAHNFYNNYAKEAGFSVRIHSSKRSRDTNEIIRKEYVCYKEGVKGAKTCMEKKRRRGIIRENCKAKLSVVKLNSSPSDNYIVTQFIEGHSHLLATPRKIHLLRSHRQISEAKRSLTRQLASANVPTHQQISILELEAGGIGNIGFIESDLRNAERDLRRVLAGHDADMLNEHFILEQEKNPAFTFTIKADNENKVTHCFWADATCRRAYQFYGDVVVFDTTYNTNRYSLIFAPLLGVNNHGQTTCFGFAFLNDETTESFCWLFEQWMKAMPVGHPKMIITDQDLAISKAIAQSLPNTFHRFCIWHIVSKFSEKINAINYKDHYKDFRSCIWKSESPEEFDERWVNVIKKSESLKENDWLNTIYGIRSKWIPSYVNHIFSAGMASSQRAEISHAFFKRYVSKNNSLMDFVTRFSRALKRQRHKELNLDHKDINEKPELKTLWLIEQQMAEIYTNTIFYRFQKDLWKSMIFVLEIIRETENQIVYKVQKANDKNSRARELVKDKDSDYVTCSCRKFESEGLPCKHLLAYFNKNQNLPDKYILRRWTKAAKFDRVLDESGMELKDVSDTSLLMRHTRLFQLASNVIDDAVLSEEASDMLRENLELMHTKIKLMRKGGVATKSIIPSQQVFNDPCQVRAKGCGKRLKGGKEKAYDKGKEKAQDKGRQCHGCGLVGQSHDKRNCPTLNSR